LLTNLLSDIPPMTIATDAVDRELVGRPHRWNVGFIRAFMVTFGLISSVFDYLTFGALLYLFHATVGEFRTGWFTASVLTELLIMLVIRTRRPSLRSRPSRPLLLSTLLLIVVTVALPYSPLHGPLDLSPLSLPLLAFVVVIALAYVLASELAKRVFYRHVSM
jgi:Mg2+-importing ATPase